MCKDDKPRLKPEIELKSPPLAGMNNESLITYGMICGHKGEMVAYEDFLTLQKAFEENSVNLTIEYIEGMILFSKKVVADNDS